MKTLKKFQFKEKNKIKINFFKKHFLNAEINRSNNYLGGMILHNFESTKN
jgi:hypothetical protein